ncbi:hypothetical protein BGZ46_010176 [Entomortierella lignicola]|nr:hypothetical protein BGZ46_010176 [Entomortierella lignicola]
MRVLVSAFIPQPVSYMAYASVDEKTLYIQGGSTDTSNTMTNQFFALDLTVPNWSASNPPWRSLSVGGGVGASAPQDVFHTMAVTQDKQKLVVWGFYTGVSIYNIATGTWTNQLSSPYQYQSFTSNLHALTDPSTGYIYIPSGAVNGSAMAQYDPSTQYIQVLKTQSASTGGVLYSYSAVWSPVRSSILVYGGDTSLNGSSPQLYEYKPSTSQWANVTPPGVTPGDVSRACMVPAYNGTKTILFGGMLRTGYYSNSLYIMDGTTLTFTLGASVGAQYNQSGMACTVVQDYFIAWGGYLSGDTHQLTPIIYNIKQNAWVNSVTLTSTGTSSNPNPSTTSSPGPGSKSSTSSSSSSSGPIIGGVVGGVVVVFALVGFLFYRKRKNRKDIVVVEPKEVIQSSFVGGNGGQNTIPYNNVPQNTVPYNNIPQNTVPYSNIPQNTVPYSSVPQNTVPYGNVQQSTMPYSTVGQNNVLYPNAAQNIVPYTIATQNSTPYDNVAQNNVSYTNAVHNNIPFTNAIHPMVSPAPIFPDQTNQFGSFGQQPVQTSSSIQPVGTFANTGVQDPTALYSNSSPQYVESRSFHQIDSPQASVTSGVYVDNTRQSNNPHTDPVLGSPQAIYTPESLHQQPVHSSPVATVQIPIEQQIAQIKYQQQNALENLRLEQQAQLELLEQRLLATKRDPHT